MDKTVLQYDSIITKCREIFTKKMKDYGTAWRILRTSSLTDQIFIKAKRIRSIEDKGINKVGESIDNEYIGMINYSLMALIQQELGITETDDTNHETVLASYDKQFEATKQLMLDKNHDYGEAWRDMRVSSLTDLILMKILRIKQIEDNEGKTLISEGIDANFQDIINYSVFALIKLEEETKESVK